MIAKNLDNLTSLRFFAALYVFLFHMEIRWPLPLPKFFGAFLSQGAVGMTLFFVLSGFILTYNYYDKLLVTNYFAFLMKRFARIYPIYLLSALVSLPWFGIQLSLHLKSIAQMLFMVLTNIFLLQAWIPALFYLWNDGLSWSLSVELFCYLLFPLLLFGFKKITARQAFIILIACYILTILPGMGYTLFTPQPISPTVYAMPIFRLPEFIVGLIFGIFFLTLKTPKYPGIKLSLVALLTIVYLGRFSQVLPPIYVTQNFIVVPAFALIIYYLAHSKSKVILGLFNNKVINLLGEASFSFYMMQVLPINLGYYLIKKPFAANHHWLLALLLLALNLLLAFSAYFFVETPCRKAIINYTKKSVQEYRL